MKKMKEIKDYIVVMNNIMPPPLVDMIFAEYKKCNDWIPAIIKNGENLNLRNCQTIGLSFDNIIEKNKELRQKIDRTLYTIAAQAIKEYTRQFLIDTIEQDSGYELLKYEEGGFYVQHTDSFKDRPRAVSCSFMLNDDYEGGEFAFFDRELKYKLKKGSCIMFPSNFMYPHEIMPVTSGTRYSIITWFV
jgi:Rps23 Pro-64 3,4-dihydroxylase Tpa1-like proline 4-hydroxylase